MLAFSDAHVEQLHVAGRSLSEQEAWARAKHCSVVGKPAPVLLDDGSTGPGQETLCLDLQALIQEAPSLARDSAEWRTNAISLLTHYQRNHDNVCLLPAEKSRWAVQVRWWGGRGRSRRARRSRPAGLARIWHS
jgi:hypothetical protein